MRIFKSDLIFQRANVCDLGHALWHVDSFIMGFELGSTNLIPWHQFQHSLPPNLILDECLPKEQAEILGVDDIEELHIKHRYLGSGSLCSKALTDKSRMHYFGRVNKNYVNKVYPAYPADLDHRYFQMASEQYRLPFMLMPNMSFKMLAPSESNGLIPPYQLRLFRPDHIKQLKELSCQCDTLWLFPTQGLAAVVWRCVSMASDIVASNISTEMLILDDLKNQRSISEIQNNYHERSGPQSADFALVQNDLEPLSWLSSTLANQVPAYLKKQSIKSEKAKQAVPFDELYQQHIRQDKSLKEVKLNAAKTKQCQFAGQTISHRNFSGQNLKQADFTGATLHNCDFSNANLSSSVFDQVTCTQCYFDGANFERSSVTETVYLDCFFRQTNFNLSRFSHSCLTQSDCRYAVFNRSQFDHVSIENSQFSGALFSQAVFLITSLERCCLNNTVFKKCHFQKSTLQSLSIAYAKFSKSNFCETNFRYCTVSNTVFNLVNFHSLAEMVHCHFDRSHLNGCNFGKRIIEQCQFNNCELNQTDFAKAQLIEVTFNQNAAIGVDMSHARLIQCHFESNDFERARFVNAQIKSPTWQGNNTHNALFAYAQQDNKDIRCLS